MTVLTCASRLLFRAGDAWAVCPWSLSRGIRPTFVTINALEDRGVRMGSLTATHHVLMTGGVLGLVLLGPAHATNATSPKTVAIWNRIAEDAVIRSTPFQNEGLIYMAYVSAAVYDAVVAVEGGYAPYGPGVTVPSGASVDAAVLEAAYRTLVHYLPAQTPLLDPLYAEGLAAIPDGQPKNDGLAAGQAASDLIIALRAADGRMPLASTSLFPTKTPAPGVWRLTPPAFAAPQTPWVGNVLPFLIDRPNQFLPDPPPSLHSTEWAEAYNEIRAYGGSQSTARSAEETATALFWTANVIRQYNRAARDLIDMHSLNVLESARLQAMVNIVAADAQIAVMNAKYHYLFWRPVTAIDPESVKPTGDGFGPFPRGFSDENPATGEERGWRPIGATPNHPEYPAAHGSITSAMAEVFSQFLGTNRFGLVVRGFDPAGAAGNLDAVRHFATPAEMRQEIVDARVWAGFHYRFSGVEGVVLGRKVAKSALRHAFGPVR